MIQKVWRVEDEKGHGPYRTSKPDFWVPMELQIGPDHPTPDEDFTVFRHTGPDDRWYDTKFAADALLKGYLFGFPTREAALRWFGVRHLADMADHGFVLKELPAAEVLVSDSGRQCIFRRHHEPAQIRRQ